MWAAPFRYMGSLNFKMVTYDYIIYTDGSGESSYLGGRTVSVVTKDGKTPIEIICEEWKDKHTCNEAEYKAVILALSRVRDCSALIKTDSSLVVNQLNPVKPWKINFEHLRLLNTKALDIMRIRCVRADFVHVPRDDNLAGRFIEGKLVYDRNVLRVVQQIL